MVLAGEADLSVEVVVAGEVFLGDVGRGLELLDYFGDLLLYGGTPTLCKDVSCFVTFVGLWCNFLVQKELLWVSSARL